MGSRCHQTSYTPLRGALSHFHVAPAHSLHTDSYKQVGNAVRAHLFNYFDTGDKSSTSRNNKEYLFASAIVAHSVEH